ncbi:MAG: hypothetical protein ACE364_02045 [Chlorobiota bacterium]
MKNLTEEEMRDLLSDYAFGKLSDYETSIFESNLSRFPEMENEIVEIKSVFSNLKKEKIKESLDNRTANISYKVNQKKYSKQRNRNLIFSVLKYSVPVLLFVIGFFAIEDYNINPKNTNHTTNTQLLSDLDLTIALGESSELKSNNIEMKSFNFDDGLLLTPSESIKPSDIEEMSENEFNELLDELSNEKFDI